METPNPITSPTPLDSADAAGRVAELTGMTADSARTFMDFHTGSRWLRRLPDAS
jgi:hypothetical protein